jgi:O-antigen/teichoic acid export membrane protein
VSAYSSLADQGRAGFRLLLKQTRDPTSGSGRAITSIVWTLGGQVVNLLLTFAVSVVVANYLGVSQFGRLVFVVAIVTLLVSLATAGLQSIVIRDLVRTPDEAPQILGTSFVVRLGSGATVFVLLMLVTVVTHWRESDQVMLAVVASLFITTAPEVTAFWFQAQTRLRYVMIAKLSETVLGGGSRILLVLIGGSLLELAGGYALEAAVGAAVLVVLYRRFAGSPRVWRFEPARARKYLRQSLPLTLGAAAGSISLKVDQILLGILLSSAAVGTYAVAARLSEVWYFVPSAVSVAVFPAILRAKEQSEPLYRKRMQVVYGLFFWGAIAVAIAMTFISKPLIGLLYSRHYAGAAAILEVHIWSAPFLFMNALLNRWMVIERLFYLSLSRQAAGALLNIALNLVLIPRYGPTGSAIATLVSYACTVYGMSFLSKRTWPAAMDMTRGMLLPFRLGVDLVAAQLRHRPIG